MSRKKKKTSKPALEDVEKKFKQWRRTRGKKRRIPKTLWSAAASLTDTHPVHKIAKHLHLNYHDLKKQIDAREAQRGPGRPAPVRFVEIPLGHEDRPVEDKPHWVVEISGKDGAAMKASVRGIGIDLIELGKMVLGRRA